MLADILISREQFFPAPVKRTLKVNGIIVLISKWIIQKVLHISASIILWNYINVLNTVLPFWKLFYRSRKYVWYEEVLIVKDVLAVVSN